MFAKPQSLKVTNADMMMMRTMMIIIIIGQCWLDIRKCIEPVKKYHLSNFKVFSETAD